MSATNINLKMLSEQSQELYNLIVAANGVLNDPNPVSDFRGDFEETVSELGPAMMKFARTAVATRRTPRELLMGAGIALGAITVGWTVATGIDFTRNSMAKAKAKKMMPIYYDQLVTKQNMIIEEQQRVNLELADSVANLSSNEAVYREKIQALQKKQSELANLLGRIQMFRSTVEK